MSDWSDIGAELRRERKSRGWSLRDVAHRTRIPVHTIEELEKNDYRNFPSPSYAKSFLTQYSEHLDIEVEEWMDSFEVETGLSNLKNYDYLTERHEDLGREVLPVGGLRPKPRKTARPVKPQPTAKKTAPEPVHRSESASALQPLVVFLITACLLTGGAFGYLHVSKTIADTSPETPEAPGFVEAPSIVHSRPTPTNPIGDQVNEPPVVAATVVGEEGGIAAIGVATPVHPDGSPVTFDAPPPRAVIVEE